MKHAIALDDGVRVLGETVPGTGESEVVNMVSVPTRRTAMWIIIAAVLIAAIVVAIVLSGGGGTGGGGTGY